MIDQVEAYIKPLLSELKANENPEEALKMKRYLKDQFGFFGIKANERRNICKSFLRDHGLPKTGDLSEVVYYLWDQPQRELQHFAMEVVEKFLKKTDDQLLDLLEFMITNKSWWDTVDFIAARPVGVFFKQYPELIKPVTEDWMASGNIWLQRSALLFQLKYKQDTDFKLMKKYIDQLSDSKEFFIRKAIGWILREYSKTEPQVVVGYVKTATISNFSKKEALKWLNRNK